MKGIYSNLRKLKLQISSIFPLSQSNYIYKIFQIISIQFRLTNDKQLNCTLCNVIVKNEVAWLKHSKLEQHISALKNLRDKSKNQRLKMESNLQSNDIPIIVESQIKAKTGLLENQEEEFICMNNNLSIKIQDYGKESKFSNENKFLNKNKILSILSDKSENKNQLPEVIFKIKLLKIIFLEFF
jgi:hypothetical protein